MSSENPVVLFLCTGNSARSQIGEALMRRHADGRFDVQSAGTNPQGVNPFTIRVLQESGIDTDVLRSKSIDEFAGQVPVDHLIIVCVNADQTCPADWPGVLTRDFWDLADPAAVEGDDEEKLAAFRRTRDEIEHRVRHWLGDRADVHNCRRS